MSQTVVCKLLNWWAQWVLQFDKVAGADGLLECFREPHYKRLMYLGICRNPASCWLKLNKIGVGYQRYLAFCWNDSENTEKKIKCIYFTLVYDKYNYSEFSGTDWKALWAVYGPQAAVCLMPGLSSCLHTHEQEYLHEFYRHFFLTEPSLWELEWISQ